MKEFKVIKSSSKSFLGELFETPTQIRQDVILPFTSDKYRCTMFDGVRIKLVTEDSYIVGTIK